MNNGGAVRRGEGEMSGNREDTAVAVRNGEPQRGMVVKEGFSSTELQASAELSTKALAEQARAAVEARHILARRFPRSMDVVRTKLKSECKRPAFADAAVYEKPVGGKSQLGLSIRFAEACVRAYTNIDVRTFAIHDDSTKRIVRQCVTDLESNSSFELDITIEKTVERRDGRNRVVVGRRKNSFGDEVCVVVATEDEMLVKEKALVSKAIRENVLRLVDGDIKDECWRTLEETARNQDAKDPSEARKQVIDALAFFGITPQDIADYLGHPSEKMSPAEIRQLNRFYTSIREGSTTWEDIIAVRREERTAAAEARAAGAKIESLREAIPAMQKLVAECADNLSPKRFKEITGKTPAEIQSGTASASDLRAAYEALRAAQSPQPASAPPAPNGAAQPAISKEGDPGGGQAPSTNDAQRSGPPASKTPFEAQMKSDDGETAKPSGATNGNGEHPVSNGAKRTAAMPDLLRARKAWIEATKAAGGDTRRIGELPEIARAVFDDPEIKIGVVSAEGLGEILTWIEAQTAAIGGAR